MGYFLSYRISVFARHPLHLHKPSSSWTQLLQLFLPSQMSDPGLELYLGTLENLYLCQFSHDWLNSTLITNLLSSSLEDDYISNNPCCHSHKEKKNEL